MEIDPVAKGVLDRGEPCPNAGNLNINALGIEDVSDTVAEYQGMLTRCRWCVEGKGIEVVLERRDDPGSVLIIYEIIDLAAALVHVGNGGSGAVDVFRGLRGIKVGMLAVVIGQKAYVV